jgi:hypothetical protein
MAPSSLKSPCTTSSERVIWYWDTVAPPSAVVLQTTSLSEEPVALLIGSRPIPSYRSIRTLLAAAKLGEALSEGELKKSKE